MLNLNDREWKSFMLADIFKVDLSKGDNQPSLLEKGQYPLISAGAKNNGVCYFVKEGDGKSQLFKKNTLTIDMFGTPFYHSYDFYSVSHGRVNILTAISDKFNKYVGLFIVSCITEGTKRKYTYNQMCSQKRIQRQPIMLPVTKDGQPDYAFMEQYIKEREIKLRQKYIDFADIIFQYGGVFPSLNNKAWGEFSVADIFEIKSGKRLTTADMDSGNLPFIGATELNNGITNWINTPNETLDRNVLGVNYNGSVAEAFYHPYSCVFSDDVKRLHLKNVCDEKYILLFCSILMRKQKIKYTYGYKFNGNRMARQKILLPITDNGQPDYEYMSQYAKAFMFEKYKSYLEYQNHSII